MRHTGCVKTARRAALFEGAAVIGVMVAVMWVVEIVNKIDGQGLSSDGIYPRTLSGLPGIISAPFLHFGFNHLIGNTIPFVILGLVIGAAGARRVLAVEQYGAGPWCTRQLADLGDAGYLIARGFFTRTIAALALGVVAAVLFGGALAGGLVPHPGISWQDHLFGGLGGILAARLLTRVARRPKASTA